MTFKELQKKIPFDTVESEWHQHENGGGWVQNTATVDDNAHVYGDAWVYGDAPRTPFTLIGYPYEICEYAQGCLAIGCEHHDLDYWLEHFNSIMAKHKQTTKGSDMYFNVLLSFGAFLKMKEGK